MDAKGIRTLFDYHYVMFDSVWGSVGQLTVDQFVEENGYSLGSVRNHLAHCMNVDDRWLARLRERATPDNLEFDRFSDRAAVKVKWGEIRNRVSDYVGSLTEAELNHTVSVGLPSRFREPKQYTRREILLHMVNHGTDHRAQILARLHELGAPTLEQDLVLFLWEKS